MMQLFIFVSGYCICFTDIRPRNQSDEEIRSPSNHLFIDFLKHINWSSVCLLNKTFFSNFDLKVPIIFILFCFFIKTALRWTWMWELCLRPWLVCQDSDWHWHSLNLFNTHYSPTSRLFSPHNGMLWGKNHVNWL